MNDQIGTRLAPNMVFQNLIGGHDRPASDGMELDVLSPVDGSLSPGSPPERLRTSTRPSRPPAPPSTAPGAG